MQKRLQKLIGLFAGTAIVGMASAASADRLMYNTFMPPLAIEAVEAQAFFEDLSETTGGDLSAQVFVGGQMLGGNATLGGIRDGVVDGGFIVPTLNSSEIPHVAMLPELLPFADNFWAAAGATNETMMLNCAECIADLEHQNAVWLGGHAASPWYLMCAEPIEQFSDLSGRKIRVTGGFAVRLINALGAVPVSLPASEVGPALQQGQVDCAVGNLAWLETLGLIDSVRSIVDQPIGSYHGLGEFVFNKGSVDRLDPANREALLSKIPGRIAQITKTYADQEASARTAGEEKGIVFWQPDDAYNEAMEDFRSRELDAVAADIVKLGGSADAEAIVRQHIETLERWKGLVADVEGDPEAFAELLEREVFSKLGQ
ncbi:TRAP transporter substrate-binding protein DctP [Salipiger abyssi]|uniref:TRAP transporter substrate-binding protein DctP n=1 Tax=Salipiger abyssi TaxID=1250539 RepID=UPI001A8EA295|nr:TRAP transporter substrate-binding protein DctP [Salipiger abyssi]MBN9888290.1 TRAP transporter substrate-binding protein DctP [Salipiger abyssi]